MKLAKPALAVCLLFPPALLQAQNSGASPDATRPSVPPPESTPQAHRRPSTITVSGQGQVNASPDRARVSLGVASQRSTAAEAQQEVNAAISRSLDAITSLGIPRKSITTASINLYPVYEQPRPRPDGTFEESPRIIGYRASNTIRITADDLTLIGKVIDAAIKSGCNQLEGVTFELKDDSSQRREALAGACVDAAAKAQTIADTLRLRIIGIDEINEGGINIQPPIPMFRERAMAAMDAGTSVEPGQLTVGASVTVRYIVEPVSH